MVVASYDEEKDHEQYDGNDHGDEVAGILADGYVYKAVGQGGEHGQEEEERADDYVFGEDCRLRRLCIWGDG